MDNTANSFQTPSFSSASSELTDYGPSQATASVFDSKSDGSPRAWCPSRPVHDDMREWLQLEFDGLKVIKMLITWGLSSKPDRFVPYFFIRYQRDEGHWYDYSSQNGTKLIVANDDSQKPKTISLWPPITARLLRILPYRSEFSQQMCLKLTVLGHEFHASLLSYDIPEGDVYRMQSQRVLLATLNDSSYDGIRIVKRLNPQNNKENQRNLLSGGLGVLVDRHIFEGGGIRQALEPPLAWQDRSRESSQTLRGLVGWFCRSGLPLSPVNPPCQSRNVSLLFTFDSVRQFTDLRIHVLNSFAENIAVFREALVQFSVSGNVYDRYGPPVVYLHPRNVTLSRPTWIIIPLQDQIGRFVRITLTFDSDWIILSEVAFSSTQLAVEIDDSKQGLIIQTTAPSISPSFKSNTPTVIDTYKKEGSHAYSHAQLPVLDNGSSRNMSWFIGVVCVVGFLLISSIFMYFVCCRYRGCSHGRCLLMRCKGEKRHREQKPVVGGINGLPETREGRLLAFDDVHQSAAYCLLNDTNPCEISSSCNPASVYPRANRNDAIFSTLHLMQQSSGSAYDPITFCPVVQSNPHFASLPGNSAVPTLTASTCSATPYYQMNSLPPPPDQPFPPLPSGTPTPRINCGIPRPSSSVNPYAASSSVSIPSGALSGGIAATAMMTSAHTESSMADYASASLINGHAAYPLRPLSIHGGSGSRMQYPTCQDIYLQSMMGATHPLLPNNIGGVLPIMVSCSSGFCDGGHASIPLLTRQTRNSGPIDTLM